MSKVPELPIRKVLAATVLVALVLGAALVGVAAEPDPKTPADVLLFETRVQPILKAKCYGCHGEKIQKAELTLSTHAGIVKGGESGPIIAAGQPDESPLLEMVVEGLMPPDGENPLSESEIEAIRRWIEAGAKFVTQGATERTVVEDDIVPIMLLRCTICHGLRNQEAGLDLRSRASMIKGGKSGPAIVPGKPDQSLILEKINSGQMPPRRRLVEVSIKTMDSSQTELLTKWIAQGAPVSPEDSAAATSDPPIDEEAGNFWSFQPPRSAAVPRVEHADRVRNPVDAFLLRKLEAKGLSLSEEADRLTLLRRAYFDLTGLPPAPHEVDAFLADSDPLAYEKLIDRLLASPRYGERWARYWLDLAGYSDSEGVSDSDPIRVHGYRYRDYVIGALNADKPYDRFLLEQLAGDELADYEHAEVITDELYDNLVATGFLRMAADGSFANITNFVPDRLNTINDEIEILATSVMGLTLKCARCHSHKFDPISQREYYRLTAIFKGAYDEHDWMKPYRGATNSSGPWGYRYLTHVTTRERSAWESHQKNLQTEIDTLKASLEQKRQQLLRSHLDDRLARLPEPLREDLRKMLAAPAQNRDEIQRYLAAKFEQALRIDPAELAKIDPDFKRAAEETAGRIKTFEAKRRPEPLIRALWDRGQPSPTYILRRGNYFTPGDRVAPGVPAALTGGATPFEVKPPWPGARQSGRRLAFARWLTGPDHPLTARVMVNRIWKYHFGGGIVKSLDNFGKTGTPPTHPELLDWLAVEMAAQQGWSIKAMHRLMMTSSAYRQSSRVLPVHERLDPDNRLVSRMPLRRLDGEALRDTLLLVSGRLDQSLFGPSVPVEVRKDGLITPVETSGGWRRSIYVRQRRTQPPTFLENFDLPRMSPNCVDRPVSTVAPQALHLMNNGMIHGLSASFAERVIAEVGTDGERQVQQVYLVALSRRPTAEEKDRAVDTLARLTGQWTEHLKQASGDETDSSSPDVDRAAALALGNLCHAVMNSAALAYID